MVMGADMNGHVGVAADGYEGVHGGFGYGERNREGARLLEFADGAGLVLANTLFDGEIEERRTYESGGSRTLVDYVLLRGEHVGRIRGMSMVRGEECWTALSPCGGCRGERQVTVREGTSEASQGLEVEGAGSGGTLPKRRGWPRRSGVGGEFGWREVGPRET